MKGLKAILGAVCAASVLSVSSAMAVDVDVNNTHVNFDVEPQIVNDRTMVPMRAIFEVLGASVDWNGDTQTVKAVRGNTTVSLTIGKDEMTVNGAAKKLDTAPMLIEGRTLVPVRAISEALGK